METNPSWAFGSQPQHASSFAMKDNADGASQHSEGDAKSSHDRSIFLDSYNFLIINTLIAIAFLNFESYTSIIEVLLHAASIMNIND